MNATDSPMTTQSERTSRVPPEGRSAGRAVVGMRRRGWLVHVPHRASRGTAPGALYAGTRPAAAGQGVGK